MDALHDDLRTVGAYVVYLWDRVAVVGRVTHHVGFMFDAAPVASLAKHQTAAEFEDVTVASTRDQRTLLHGPPFYTAAPRMPMPGPGSVVEAHPIGCGLARY